MKRQGALSKFQRLGEAIEQQPLNGSWPNRVLARAAVADPYGIVEEGRRVRVTVNMDVLDRLWRAGRIGPGEYAAGRTYQRLLEVSLGGKALDGAGVRIAHSDDMLAKAFERAGMVLVELVRIRRRVGWRSERLLRLVLIELNPNTGRSWTLEELAGLSLRGGSVNKARIFAVSQRLVDTLEDLAAHWHAVEVE